MIVYEVGDVVDAWESRFDVLAHGCNCMVKMGAGIAQTLSSKYPEIYIEDKKTKIGDGSKLGTIVCIPISSEKFEDSKERVIVNAYTQFKYGRVMNVDYKAVDSCFKLLYEYCKKNQKSCCIPKIGSGLGGGSWKIIEKSLSKYFIDIDVTVFSL